MLTPHVHFGLFMQHILPACARSSEPRVSTGSGTVNGNLLVGAKKGISTYRGFTHLFPHSVDSSRSEQVGVLSIPRKGSACPRVVVYTGTYGIVVLKNK